MSYPVSGRGVGRGGENGATESTAANVIDQLGSPLEVKEWGQKKITV